MLPDPVDLVVGHLRTVMPGVPASPWDECRWLFPCVVVDDAGSDLLDDDVLWAAESDVQVDVFATSRAQAWQLSQQVADVLARMRDLRIGSTQVTDVAWVTPPSPVTDQNRPTVRFMQTVRIVHCSWSGAVDLAAPAVARTRSVPAAALT